MHKMVNSPFQSISGMFTPIGRATNLYGEAHVPSLLQRVPSAHRQELDGCLPVGSRPQLPRLLIRRMGSHWTEPKTNYDIYVYDPQGALGSLHTEAAGLP